MLVQQQLLKIEFHEPDGLRVAGVTPLDFSSTVTSLGTSLKPNYWKPTRHGIRNKSAEVLLVGTFVEESVADESHQMFELI